MQEPIQHSKNNSRTILFTIYNALRHQNNVQNLGKWK